MGAPFASVDYGGHLREIKGEFIEVSFGTERYHCGLPFDAAITKYNEWFRAVDIECQPYYSSWYGTIVNTNAVEIL